MHSFVKSITLPNSSSPVSVIFMFINHLSLTGFRNYSRLEQDLAEGITVLHGNNAQGKTNLLESIYYLATTRSPYAESDQQLINWNTNIPDEPIVVARLVATVQSQVKESTGSLPEPKTIELRLIRELKNGSTTFRREAVINRHKVRLMDLLGQLRVVLFLPSDLELITGSPAARRRYLDITLCQADPVYLRNLSNFNKVLDQRNAALKTLSETGRGKDVVNILSDRLAEFAAELFARRAKFMLHLAQEAGRIHYEDLTGGTETIKLGYLPRLTSTKVGRGANDNSEELLKSADWLVEHMDDTNQIARKYSEILQLSLDKDILSGVTQSGPHRDDWRFWVNGRHLAHFGSRGQQRTAMLALKIAEIRQLTVTTGDPPILLLDEVASELDEHRRELLLAQISNSGQAILTTTDLSFFSDSFLNDCNKLHVSNGLVSETAKTPSQDEPISDHA